jgi:hypothetical protein
MVNSSHLLKYVFAGGPSLFGSAPHRISFLGGLRGCNGALSETTGGSNTTEQRTPEKELLCCCLLVESHAGSYLLLLLL